MTSKLVVAAVVLLMIAGPASANGRVPRGRIVYSVVDEGREGRRSGIYTVRPDGSDGQRLTTATDTAPLWSPGHRFIAYTRRTLDGIYLRVMTDDGESDHLIARLGERDSYGTGRYAWSPDGSSIAFEGLADDGLTTDIFVASPDGSDIRDVTARPGSERQPVWSPDGQRLAFVGLGISDLDPGGSPYGIFTIDVDGGDLRQVTTSEGDLEPVWSPDGERIAFSSYRNDCCYSDPESEGPYMTDVFVVDADGSDERQLTDNDCHWESGLTWLPDSSGIVYSASDDDDGCLHPKDAEIRLVRLGGTVTNLTRNRRGDFSPALSPSGRWITFHGYGTRRDDSDPEIFILSLVDGGTSRLTRNGGRMEDVDPDW